jgi:uncharacterized repeat protein (TIGR04138 family)
MLCEQCHKNDATIFLTQVCEGETTKLALCATCGAPFTQRTISPEQLVAWLQSGQSNNPFPFASFDQVAANHPHYAREAFLFVRDGVYYALQSHARESRHVSAAELLDALRALAIEKYGSNAREQLRSWGVTQCEDLGEIVFTLIERGVFGKRPEDRKEDFKNGYDFATAFPAATT